MTKPKGNCWHVMSHKPFRSYLGISLRPRSLGFDGLTGRMSPLEVVPLLHRRLVLDDEHLRLGMVGALWRLRETSSRMERGICEVSD